jgi:hypothetical protein
VPEKALQNLRMDGIASHGISNLQKGPGNSKRYVSIVHSTRRIRLGRKNMKDADKIEVEVGDLRYLVRALENLGAWVITKEKYPAAFAPEPEWEDVTDRIIAMLTDPEISDGILKIENNRILQRK